MKFILPLLFVLASGFSGNAATISGYVNVWRGGAMTRPVYNKTVYIVDSTATHYYLDSVSTEYDGHYSYIVPASFTSGNLRVYTLSIPNGSFPSVIVYYNGTSISNVNFTIWTQKHAVWGKTTIGGAANNGPTKLYLIRKAYDASLMDTTLTALDSFYTIGNTGGFNREYDSSAYSLTSGGLNSLLIKAALMPAHTSYATCLPAYSYNSLNWNGANRIDSCDIMQPGGSAYKMANIDLPVGSNPGGPGFIGGSVLLGANKTSGVGDPLSGRILLLTTAAGKAVGFTTSNASGKFSFSNLANGSYLIFGDAWGKDNPPLTVTISATAPTVSNIIFEENSSEFKGHYNALSVSATSGLPFVSIYPNPASSNVFLQGLANIEGDKEIVLRDIRGVMLTNTHIKAGSNASVPTAQLPAGIYILQVQTAQGVASYRFVRQ